MNITVKRATLENLTEIGELFNSYRVFYKQDSNLELALIFISERMKNKDSVIFYACNEKETGYYVIFMCHQPLGVWVSVKN